MNQLLHRFRTMSLRRRIATVMTAVAVIAVLVAIFLFSAENKNASGGRSGRVTGWLVTLFCGSDLSPEAHAALVERWGHTVRKLAHMTEFAALTASLAAWLILARPLRTKPRRWVEWVIPAAVCVLYAASDEVHQIFSQRGPAVIDVLIDCAGGLIGLCVLHALAYVATRLRARIRARSAVAVQGESSCN